MAGYILVKRTSSMLPRRLFDETRCRFEFTEIHRPQKRVMHGPLIKEHTVLGHGVKASSRLCTCRCILTGSNVISTPGSSSVLLEFYTNIQWRQSLLSLSRYADQEVSWLYISNQCPANALHHNLCSLTKIAAISANADEMSEKPWLKPKPSTYACTMAAETFLSA